MIGIYNHIDKQIEILEAKINPLREKLWSLQEKKQAIKMKHFMHSNILQKYDWKLSNDGINLFLRLVSNYNKNDAILKVVPPPHNSEELKEGLWLIISDGDISISANNTKILMKYIKLWKLKVIVSDRTTEFLKEMSNISKICSKLNH